MKKKKLFYKLLIADFVGAIATTGIIKYFYPENRWLEWISLAVVICMITIAVLLINRKRDKDCPL